MSYIGNKWQPPSARLPENKWKWTEERLCFLDNLSTRFENSDDLAEAGVSDDEMADFLCIEPPDDIDKINSEIAFSEYADEPSVN